MVQKFTGRVITISIWYSLLTIGTSILTAFIMALIMSGVLFQTEVRLPAHRTRRRKKPASNFIHRYLTWLSGINTDLLETSDGMDMAAVGRLPALQAMFSFGSQDQRTPTHLDLATALHQFPRLLIIGEAGTGKSSLLRYIAATASTPSGRRVLGIDHTLVPLLINVPAAIRSLDPRVPSSLLMHVVPPQLTPPNEFPKEQLRKGRCLVLIDGLDEIVHGNDRRLVARLITSLANEFPTNRYIVASRPCTETSRLRRFAKLRLETPSYADYVRAAGELFLEEEVTDAQVGELAHAVASHTAKRDAEEFIQLITAEPELRQLTSDPFWLNLAASAYRQRGVIPKSRVQLMEQTLHFVLNYWDESRGVAAQVDGDTKIRVISELAFWMEKNGIDLASDDQVLEAFGRALDLDSQPEQLAKELLRSIQTRSGLLVEQGESLIGFSHRTIQEYLAARYLVSASDGTDDLIDAQGSSSWGDVVQLCHDIRKEAQEGRILLS